MVSADLRAVAALRKGDTARCAKTPAPPKRIGQTGAAALGFRAVAAAAPQPGDDAARHGLACAPGLVIGVARVVRDAGAAAFAQGEVPVARHADPGWIALSANAAAIVVERGGLLSHSLVGSRAFPA